MKRVKKVFKPNELPHLWVHQQIQFGHTAKSKSRFGYEDVISMTADGLAFKSYETVIARIVKHKGRKAYVLDDGKFFMGKYSRNGKKLYSVTTPAMVSQIRSAIPESEKIFTVYKGEFNQTLSEFDRLKNLVAHYYERFNREKSFQKLEHKRHETFLHGVSFLERAIDCAKFWGLASAKMENELSKLAPKIKEAREFFSARAARLDENKNAREQKRNSERIAKAIAIASGDLTGENIGMGNLSAMLDVIPPTENRELYSKVKAEYDKRTLGAREQWLNGGAMESCIRKGPVMLRAVSGEIETTLGARIPLADGERAFRFALARRTKGWRRNGETFEVGGYQLDVVNSTGIVAGCHRIDWPELERFAASQGWLKLSAPV